MFPKFLTMPFVPLFPDATPDEPSRVDDRTADISADATAFDEHHVQMEFRLTEDRRRILVAVENDLDRRAGPSR